MIEKEQKTKLLLLNEAHWKRVKKATRLFYTQGGALPPETAFASLIGKKDWLDLQRKLDTLREEHKDTLSAKRKELREKEKLTKRRTYMRGYMRGYRANKRNGESDNGSASTERSSAAVD